MRREIESQLGIAQCDRGVKKETSNRCLDLLVFIRENRPESNFATGSGSRWNGDHRQRLVPNIVQANVVKARARICGQSSNRLSRIKRATAPDTNHNVSPRLLQLHHSTVDQL